MQQPRSRVAAIANSTSLWVKEPVVVKTSIIGIATAIGSILVISNILTQTEVDQIVASLTVIIPALLVLQGILAGIWARASVDSPKTSAQAAIQNVDAAYEAGLVGEKKPDPILSPARPAPEAKAA